MYHDWEHAYTNYMSFKNPRRIQKGLIKSYVDESRREEIKYGRE